MNELLKAALEYLEQGWRVIPLHCPEKGANGNSVCSCGRKGCQSPAKHPRTKNGVKDASIDPEQIRKWWSMWPDANIGIATGEASRLVVLDIDVKANGEDSLALIEAEHGALPATPYVVRTGGGGRHFYFSHPGSGITVRNKVAIAPGVDLRGDGGYVVAPPSRHISGGAYVFC